MDVDDPVASPGAPPDGVEEVLRRKFKDFVLEEQRNRQAVFEREKETLGNERKALDDKFRHIQEEMRKLEREKAANAAKERRLEASHDADMRKLNRCLQDGVVGLQRSTPGVVSGFPFAMSVSI
jgi:hypothetical protein